MRLIPLIMLQISYMLVCFKSQENLVDCRGKKIYLLGEDRQVLYLIWSFESHTFRIGIDCQPSQVDEIKILQNVKIRLGGYVGYFK